MRHFTENFLGEIIRQCVCACGRAKWNGAGGATDGGGQNDAEESSLLAMRNFVGKLVLWVEKAQEMGWIAESDAKSYFKMLWGVNNDSSSCKDATDFSSTSAFAPSSGELSSLLSLLPPRLEVLDACVLAAAGDAPGATI